MRRPPFSDDFRALSSVYTKFYTVYLYALYSIVCVCARETRVSVKGDEPHPKSRESFELSSSTQHPYFSRAFVSSMYIQ